jgi:hypothetical protein
MRTPSTTERSAPSDARTAVTGDRRSNLKVTPQMIKAGARVLTSEYDLIGSEIVAEGIVRRVFDEMASAASRRPQKSRIP